MWQVHESEGYKFEFNATIKSPITIYEPNQTKSCSSISGPIEAQIYLYKIKCEDWLLNKGILTKKDYYHNVGQILIEALI